MKRRTKIIATLGPATEDPKVMDEIISAGIDVVRVNFSHDKIEEHVERIETLRNRVRSYGHQIGVLVDLQGPKIRIEKFKKGKIKLKKDSVFTLDTNLDKNAGDENRVGINYANLAEDVSRGDTLLLDDGAIVLWVNKVEDNEITCKVIVGGKLSDNKGLNRQGGGLSAPALTEKDKEDLVVAAEMNADFVAVSFVRSASDIEEARELFQQAGGTGGIIAKIE